MTAVNATDAAVTEKLQQAIAFHREGRLARAQALYEKILKLQPRQFDALHLLGVIAAQTDNPARALTLIGRAIEINAHSADAFCNLGSACNALGRFDEALRAYGQAIALRPGYAEAHCCRGRVFGALGRWGEALQSCNRAIELQPSYVDAYLGRARALKTLGQADAALATYDRAIALNPNIAATHNDKGILLRELGDRDAALANYERALAVDGRYVHAHLNRGNVFMDLYRLDEALHCFGQAIVLKSDFAEARANRASILLLRGDFSQGWSDYEWRWKVKGIALARKEATLSQAPWLGTKPISGKSVLLVAAQGLGDTLQFCRYAPLVAQRGAKVLLQVPRSLVALLTTVQGIEAVYADEDPLPEFDVYSRITSLPLAFRTTLFTIPADVPYVHSTPDKAEHWRRKLGEKHRLRVGLTWSGLSRPNEREGWSLLNHRMVPLAKLAILKHPDIEFFSLQKGQPAESELAHLRATHWHGPDLIDHSGELLDFSETAALIEQLDLVISVDTSIAHLTGAMGKPVWILLCFDSCWRWMTNRSDSPWYPTARLYRQERAGDWDSVVEQVHLDLDAWVEATRR